VGAAVPRLCAVLTFGVLSASCSSVCGPVSSEAARGSPSPTQAAARSANPTTSPPSRVGSSPNQSPSSPRVVAQRLTFSGQVQGTLTQATASCPVDSSGDRHWAFSGVIGSVPVDIYLFPVAGFYNGPGRYGPRVTRPAPSPSTSPSPGSLVPTSQDATTVAMRDGNDGETAVRGSLVVNRDQRTGTIQMDLGQYGSGQTQTTIAGSWSC
jgi:hypothetical protein